MNAHEWFKRAANALAALMVLALVSVAAPPVVVHAATTRSIGVDNISDGSPLLGCTLREAISIANAGLTGTHDGCTVNQSGSGTPITYYIHLPKGGYLYTLAGMPGAEEDNNLSGDLDITANVHIIGWGAGTTIIDAAEKDRVFHICPDGGCDNNVTLSGVTIRNGNLEGWGWGGGIYNRGDTLIVQNCTVSANTAYLGGGIFDREGTLTVTGSSIISNTATKDGGGIYNRSGTQTVEDSTISGNTACFGGGIYNDYSTVTVQDSTLSGNTAGGGGGIGNSYGTMAVNGSTISDNEALYYGGAISNYTSTLTVQNSIISGNQARDGGGIRNYGGEVVIDGSTISDNEALHYSGGIYNEVGTVVVDDSAISGNTAFYRGGGIRNWGTLTVRGSTISGNAVGSGCGGGIYNYANAVVDGSTISDNTATSGGGICNDGTLTVTGSRILNNTATTNGGGVSTYADLGGATSVTGSCIMGNSDTAFFSDEAAMQTATGNWWGSASGPSGVGPGTGDSVSENVDYGGFLTEPILGCYHYTYLPVVVHDFEWVSAQKDPRAVRTVWAESGPLESRM
jgi:hypothetical protein